MLERFGSAQSQEQPGGIANNLSNLLSGLSDSDINMLTSAQGLVAYTDGIIEGQV